MAIALTCAYRECSSPVEGRSRIYCSSQHAQAEYVAQREERRVYSLSEIATMPSAQVASGYINRRLNIGVWVGEHVLVMESELGCRLPIGASVHHRNGVRDDNDPSNLELWLSTHPAGQRLKCPQCGWPDLAHA